VIRLAIITTDNREQLQKYQLPEPWMSPPIAALLEGFQSRELSNQVEVHVLSCTRQPMASSCERRGNVFFYSLHVPKMGWLRTGYQGCIRAVRRKLKEIEPEIVHGQGTERDCAISTVFSGYPNVLTLHGIMREMAHVLQVRPGSYLWFASWLESLALRRTEGVFCISKYTEAKLKNRCRKTWWVPNPLPSAFFTEPLPPKGPKDCNLLNVGTVCSYKRQNELLTVLEELSKEGLRFHAHFVGSTSGANDYTRSFQRRIQNCPFVTHHPFKTKDEIIGLYDCASALVHVSSIETFGLVVAESLARNLKFIGFKSGGVADVIEGVNGAEGFEDQDWRGLKSALGKWIAAGFPCPQPAAPAMRERYDPVVVARRHLEIYRQVIRHD